MYPVSVISLLLFRSFFMTCMYVNCELSYTDLKIILFVNKDFVLTLNSPQFGAHACENTHTHTQS